MEAVGVLLRHSFAKPNGSPRRRQAAGGVRGVPSERLFVRIHRSHVVNLRAVTKFVGNTVWLGDLSLPIGEKYRDGFLSRLDIL